MNKVFACKNYSIELPCCVEYLDPSLSTRYCDIYIGLIYTKVCHIHRFARPWLPPLKTTTSTKKSLQPQTPITTPHTPCLPPTNTPHRFLSSMWGAHFHLDTNVHTPTTKHPQHLQHLSRNHQTTYAPPHHHSYTLNQCPHASANPTHATPPKRPIQPHSHAPSTAPEPLHYIPL